MKSFERSPGAAMHRITEYRSPLHRAISGGHDHWSVAQGVFRTARAHANRNRFVQLEKKEKQIMILEAFTLAHTLISLVGIFSGLIVMYGLLNARQLNGWTSVFLWTTVLTSATGFLFPYHGFKPSYVVGVISLVVLAIALFAWYRRHLEGGWRNAYVITAMMALYLNVFVLVVQLFRRVPALKELAPTQTESPFKLTQLVVLLVFVGITIVATTKFRRAQFSAA